jgi:hypothetical protein
MSASASASEDMYVLKRNGEREIVAFDKILQRIKKIGQEANIRINYTALVMKVIDQLYDGISTTKIDELKDLLYNFLGDDAIMTLKEEQRCIPKNRFRKNYEYFLWAQGANTPMNPNTTGDAGRLIKRRVRGHHHRVNV